MSARVCIVCVCLCVCAHVCVHVCVHSYSSFLPVITSFPPLHSGLFSSCLSSALLTRVVPCFPSPLRRSLRHLSTGGKKEAFTWRMPGYSLYLNISLRLKITLNDRMHSAPTFQGRRLRSGGPATLRHSAHPSATTPHPIMLHV